jgi:hypothetical protein
VRIIAIRPARHTEVDYLVKVQVIDFADCVPSAGKKATTKNQKLTNVFRPARIYANLHVGCCVLVWSISVKSNVFAIFFISFVLLYLQKASVST